MTNDMSRYVQLDGWIFEVKMVRALRVDNYGKPYNAISNININGDSAYIDGLMTSQDDDFSRDDFQTFIKFGQQLGLKEMKFDRYKNNKVRSVSIDLTTPIKEGPELRLVR